MADLIPSNDEQQEMAKQVEAIAEAAAQHDSQIAQMLNLVPKAAALSTAASRAIDFTKKTWVDDPTSGTPITAADMNRLEQAIVDLNTTLTSVQNSVSQATEDTGWLYLWQSGTLYVRYRKIGPIVYLWWIVPQENTNYWTCPTPLPEGFRPSGNTYVSSALANGSGYATNQVALCCVEGRGTVGFQAGAAVSGAYNRGSCCFAAL